MNDDERKFIVDYSKRASKCQNSSCKGAIEIGSLRLGRVGPSPFGDGDMKQYFHSKCIFETLKRARAATKIIESADDIDGFDKIKDDDQKEIIKLIKELSNARSSGGSPGKNKTIDSMLKKKPEAAAKRKADDSDDEKSTDIEENDDDDDDDEEASSSNNGINFETFQKICDGISGTSSHLEKTAVLKKFFDKQKNLKNLTENAYIFYKLLLPNSVNRVFNLDSKQLVKIYSQLFDTDLDEMNEHLNKGDVSETVRHYFKKSTGIKPANQSSLTCAEIDSYLDDLGKLSKESDQTKYLSKVTKRMTPLDLRMFVRLIKKDLRIDAGHKVILESISPNAYQAYQASRDLKDVIERGLQKTGGLKKDLSIRVNLMTPVKPMLAEACKSAEQAFAKCKNGILTEIKYDGERLQVHKNGDKYDYFSRNLKKVSEHKTEYLKEYIPKAMPQAKQLILDGEVLLYDTKNKCPLPFGTLGKHKKNKFQDATVCYFIFDCVYYNGESLLNKTMEERRAILEKNIKEIPGRIMLSEQRLIKEPQKLKDLMMEVIKKGLEGLVLKDTKSIYEPGKRHWLKMKKDYLESGSMADTADLVVLGAYFGTGNKGGMKSTFLMGCLNEKTKKWHTVTKVANGLDDKTLAKLQKSIEMVQIRKKVSAVPDWLVINKTLVPDFIVKSPEKSPVWELTGAEFSKSDKHTADGISIRFPRITKIRDDKTWKEATSLQRLKKLFEISKQKSDIADEEDEEEEEEVKKPSPLKRKLTGKKAKESDDEDDDAIETKVVKKVRKNPNDDAGLPSLFEDMVFCIMSDVPQAKELKRYILAYDGEVVDEKLADKATHIVLNNLNDKLPELKKGTKVEKLTHEKLWEAIKRKKF